MVLYTKFKTEREMVLYTKFKRERERERERWCYIPNLRHTQIERERERE